METLYLTDTLETIDINATGANVEVSSLKHTSLTPPYIMFNKEYFNVQIEKDQKLLLVRKSLNNVIQKSKQKNSFFTYTNSTTIIVNGNIIEQYGFENSVSPKIKLVLDEKELYKFKIALISGNINIENLNLLHLFFKSTGGNIYVQNSNLGNAIINLTGGNITMHDVEIIDGNLKTVGGNIDLNIANFSENYSLQTKTVGGRVKQISTATGEPIIESPKRKIKTNQVGGNAKIVFKGKNL